MTHRKLTPEQIMKIYQSKDKTSILAERFGVSDKYIRQIRNGQRCSQITKGG